MNLDDYASLKRRANDAARAAAEAEGEYKSLMRRLKEEYGCGTLKDAEKLLEKLRAEEAAADAAYQEEKEKFEKEYAKELEGLRK